MSDVRLDDEPLMFELELDDSPLPQDNEPSLQEELLQDNRSRSYEHVTAQYWVPLRE